MTAGLLLTRLRSLGVNLAAVGGRLRISAARGKLTDDMKEEIAVRKEELLDLLRSGLSPDGSDLVSIPRDGVLPLSLFQQRLWVIHRLDPANVDYNMATVWQIDKPIDAAQVVHAIRDLSCRHEILRSAFRDERGTPRVHLLPADKVAIVQRDLREVCEAGAVAYHPGRSGDRSPHNVRPAGRTTITLDCLSACCRPSSDTCFGAPHCPR